MQSATMKIKLYSYLIRYRFALPKAAILSWILVFLTLTVFDRYLASILVPVVAAGSIVFVWSLGLFWWIERHYPRIEVEPGKFKSRAEMASPLKSVYSYSFFGGYAIGAILTTILCIHVAAASL